eukprot:gene8873-18117_t
MDGRHNISTNSSRYPLLNVSLAMQSDIVVFDFLIGNDDRLPHKNNYALGGCR